MQKAYGGMALAGSGHIFDFSTMSFHMQNVTNIELFSF